MLKTQMSKKISALGAASVGLLALTGCHLDMWRQSKAHPLGENDFFPNGQASRPLVAHTVARNPFGEAKQGGLRTGNPFYTGMVDGKLVKTIPTAALETFTGATDEEKRLTMLKRGQERFNIFCTPCHGRLGDGEGMIALRGLNLRRKPASYHTNRLRKLPDGHIYNVMTDGFGVMYSYASRIKPEDRWAIVAYIRTLQLSQNAKVSEIPADKVQELDKPAETSEAEQAKPSGTPESGAVHP